MQEYQYQQQMRIHGILFFDREGDLIYAGKYQSLIVASYLKKTDWFTLYCLKHD